LNYSLEESHSSIFENSEMEKEQFLEEIHSSSTFASPLASKRNQNQFKLPFQNQSNSTQFNK
jgi:hypothetical protein